MAERIITYMQKKILVIDDERDLTDTISEALAEAGFTVGAANSGKEGLERALQEHPDLIFLDIQMPDMLGTKVLEKLREDEWGRHAKVVVMTVVGDLEKMAEVIEHKVDAYILKNDLKLSEIAALAKEKLS